MHANRCVKTELPSRPVASELRDSAPNDAKEQVNQSSWHVITSEYPPQAGGVSDYTYGLAGGLAAQGDQVHVWCPACPGTQSQIDGVVVHRVPGAFTAAGLRHLGRELNQFPSPRRILVQWVPHGFGYRSMNLAFCCWLWNRSWRHRDNVEIMVHEAYLAFRYGWWRQNAAALVHRLMTIMLLRAADRVWVSIPQWEQRWRPYTLGRRVWIKWLPIPSNIPIVDDVRAAQAVHRRHVAGDNLLVGHFGTYGSPITSVLEPILSILGDDPAGLTILLMGRGSEQFGEELIRRDPRLAPLIHATGALSARDLSLHVAACDLLIQPYPDGVSSRRTSFMAGLSHGKPIVTTSGILTEPFWRETDALELAPVGDVIAFADLLKRLCKDPDERARMGRAARNLYKERFDLPYIIAMLRGSIGAVERSNTHPERNLEPQDSQRQ